MFSVPPLAMIVLPLPIIVPPDQFIVRLKGDRSPLPPIVPAAKERPPFNIKSPVPLNVPPETGRRWQPRSAIKVSNTSDQHTRLNGPAPSEGPPIPKPKVPPMLTLPAKFRVPPPVTSTLPAPVMSLLDEND